MLWLVSPEQEELVCDALVKLGWLTTEQGLHAEGVQTIQDILHCSLNEARAALRDLRERKCIEETASPADRPPGTLVRLRWVRPPAHA
jgi:Fic family protein